MITLYLGNNFAINVREGDRYLYESIKDGVCRIKIPKEACDLFTKHGLYRISAMENPEVMRVLKKVFLNCDTKDFREIEKKIGQRVVRKSMELKLTKDRTIVPLINDPEFERLDKSISNDSKPEKQLSRRKSYFQKHSAE
jgi:hypothetical protein